MSFKKIAHSGEISIFTEKYGKFRNNAYLIRCDSETILIDPGNDAESLIIDLEKEGINRLDAIFATHGHFDHIGSSSQLIANGFAEKIFVYEMERDSIGNVSPQSILLEQKNPKFDISFVRFFTDINLLNINMNLNSCLEGNHTQGSVFYFLRHEGFYFTGDNAHVLATIMRVDELFDRVKFRDLSEMGCTRESRIFPGHGNFR